MKTIAIVATGGTIAGTGKKGKTAAYHAGGIFRILFVTSDIGKTNARSGAY